MPHTDTDTTQTREPTFDTGIRCEGQSSIRCVVACEGNYRTDCDQFYPSIVIVNL